MPATTLLDDARALATEIATAPRAVLEAMKAKILRRANVAVAATLEL